MTAETITFPEFLRRRANESQLEDPEIPIDGTPDGFIRATQAFIHNLQHIGVDDGVFNFTVEESGEFVASLALRTEDEWRSIERQATRKDLENQLRKTASKLFGGDVTEIHFVTEDGVDTLSLDQS